MNKFIRVSILLLTILAGAFPLAYRIENAHATATVLPPPIARFFTSAGAPCSGCQIFTYAAGTTTPLASYTDSTGLIANANPVILDSTGSASIWISGAYKIVLEDANNVTQWTEDNIQDFFTFDNITSTSTTSLAVQNGSPLTLTTQSGKYFGPGIFVMITDNAAPTANWMHCPITSYIGTQLICTPDASAGSGTKTSWTIALSGPVGPTGPTGPTGSGAGDMTGVTNLAQGVGGVASTSTARSNLGLGSSAIVNAGTGASQMVQLTAAAKLPAVDGSLLTNVAGVPAITNSAIGKIVMGAVTIQWGQSAPTVDPVITFGTSFSNTPYSIVSTPIGGTSDGPGPVIISGTVTSSQFQMSTFRAGIGHLVLGFYWIAIGPT